MREDEYKAFIETCHDTIGIIDKNAEVSVGTTTNGAQNKIAERLCDSSILGAKSYVYKRVGGASATGDGYIIMRFLPR